jgi:hypothetical protein
MKLKLRIISLTKKSEKIINNNEFLSSRVNT